MKQKHTRIFLLFSFLILSGIESYAQYSAEFLTYREKYPNSRVVRLKQETNMVLELNKGELDVTQEIFEEDLYLDESATYGSKKSLRFSSFFELGKVEAASHIYEKNKYKELKVSDFKIKDELEGSFHDDAKSLNFIFSNLEKGSKSTLRYSEKIKNPRFLTPFFFGDFNPIVNSKFTIVADKDIQLRFQHFNTEHINLVFKEEEKRGKKIYTWEVKDVDEYEYEEDAPTYKKILPHIIPIISSYNNDGKTINLLHDVADLYSWYYSLVKEVNQQPTDVALEQLVKELITGLESDYEKVKAIYYWTQQNIKYIDFEYELGGFIPREANAVYQKKYGDCKDNSSILQEMLEVAGLKGNIAWIGTRSIPYTYEQLPTPMVDNHMILVYVDAGKTYFLDATGRYLPMHLPSPFIQGKEALISIDDKNYRIEKVPIVPAKTNAVIDTTRILLQDNKVLGSSRTHISGFHKMEFFNRLEYESKTKLKDLYNAQLQKGNNTFLINNINEINKYDYEKDFILEYDFQINDHFKKLGEEIYINLNLDRMLSLYRLEEDRKNEVEYEYKTHYSFTNVLEIPEGFKAEYVPENIQISKGPISASINYEVMKNQIIYKHEITIDALALDLEQQKLLNQVIKKIENSYKEIVILKKQ